MRTLTGEANYKVSEILIVDPLDTSVLEPTDQDTITLITCYPFYFIGFAPDRFIVRATKEDASVASDNTTVEPRRVAASKPDA